ncbi:MAG: Ig-like domain-containing protein [Gemmatimonadota bacterium]
MLSAVCGDPVGPGINPQGLRASFNFAPTFPAGAAAALHAAAIDVDNVHIIIRRLDGAVVLDTIIQFPAGVNEVSLEASVLVRGASEQFSAMIQLRSGTMTLFEGTQQIEARAGVVAPQTVAVTTHYAGPGATATRVTIAPRSLPLVPGATVQLVATVADAAGTTFSGVPLAWTSSDPTVATVSSSGLVTALNKRGSTNLVVSTLSNLTDQVSASVTLPPSVSRIISGGGQTARVGSTLPQPLVVEVDAADGVPSAGVAVTFRPLSPNATVSPASGTTDASGRVSTTLTLGGSIGAQSFEVAATALPTLTVSATATPGLPTKITVVGGSGQRDTVGKPLALPLVVRVTDDFGNSLQGIPVSWTRNGGSGAVSAASSVTDATGQASVTYTLGSTAGNESIVAALDGGASATFGATALARPPTNIVATTATTQSGTVGTTGLTLSVLVTNDLAQPVSGVVVSWDAAGKATVATATTVTGPDGRASNTVTYDTTIGPATVVASFGGSAQVQFNLTAVAGQPTQFLVDAGDRQSANAGSTLPVRPAVRVLDARNNPVGAAVTFTVTGGGGTVTGSQAFTDSTGVASVGSWTLGPAGPQSLKATYGFFLIEFTATSTPVGPPQLAVTIQPNTSQQNATPLTTNPHVQLEDFAGAPLTTSGIPVTVALSSSGQTLGGALTVNTNASGVAVFSGLSILGSVGSNQMVFTSPGYTSATSAPFSITPGAPSQLVAVTSTLFTGAAGSTASPTPAVALKDVSGNPIAGETVTFAPASAASGTVTGGSAVTNASGTASPTSWTLHGTAGKDSLIATYGSVSGSPITFVATTGSTAAYFYIASGNGQTGVTGQPLAAPLVVEVQDASENLASGVTVTFTVTGGGGSPATQDVVTGANGRASFTWTLGAPGPQSVTASTGSLSVQFTATSTPAAPPQLAVAVEPNSTIQNATAFSTSPQIQLKDNAGAIATTSGVPVTVSLASESQNLVGTLTVNTNASGIAVFNGLSILGNVGTTQMVFTSSGYTSATSASFTITPGAPSQLVALTPTSMSGTVGAAASPLPSVALKDVSGNGIAGQTVTFGATSSASGTVTGGAAVTNADGAASPTSWTFDVAPGKDTLLATFGSVAGSPISFVATTSTGAATQLVVISGNAQTAVSGQPLAAPLVVEARDALGNLVSGVTVTFAVTGGGGSPSSQNVVTGSDGRASFTWTMGVAGPQSLTASAASLSASFTATSTPAGPPQLAVSTQPNATQQNATPFTTNPQVQVKDNGGALVTTAGVPVTVSLATTGQTLSGTVTVNTNASGIAVFTDLSILGTVGINQMVFASSGYTSVTSASFTVTAGVASQLAAVTSTSLTGTVGSVASPIPSVILKDVSGNPVAGQTVTFTPASPASGTVSGGSAITNSNGTANPASWTFDGTAGKDTLLATYASVSGSPLAFIATTVSGAATQLLIISGNNQTGITGQPLAAPLIVEARDALGNPVSGVTIGFAVTAGGGTPATQSVTTISDGRASFTWTLGSVGTQALRACLPSCSAQVTFNALAIPVGADAIWTGSTSTDWSTGTNWNPAVVPSSTSKVFVPTGTTFAPTLFSAASLTDLTMASGTTLTVGSQSLSVSGSLLAAGSSIVGTGTVTMTGNGKQLAGALPNLVVTGGGVITASGTTSITGTMTVTGGSVFDAGAATTTISGALTFPNSANSRLRMLNASARVVVGGDAYFNAVDMGDGELTAGVLEIKGNFTAERDRFQAFRASGTHLTKFTGTAAQVIYFYYARDDRSRFQNVEFANAQGIQFNSEVVAAGDATVLGSTALTGARLWVGRLLSTASATTLGGLTDVVVYSGDGAFPLMSGVAPPALYLATGSVVSTPAGSTTLPGALIVNSATTLDIGANTLTVNGALTYSSSSNARLRMNHPSGRMIVNGDAYFNAVDMGDGDLTAGVLELRGNVTVERDRFQSFRAGGTHLTKINGTTPQAIYFYYPRDDRSRFQNVEFANPAGITFNSEVVARGDAALLGSTALAGGRLWVGGLLSSVAGTSMASLADAVVYASGVFPLMSGAAPPALYLATGTVVSAPAGSTTLPGALIVNSGTTLDIGGSTLTVNGGLTYASSSNARLRMTNPAGHFIVKGDAYFNAVDMGDNDLTAGVLEFRGNVTVERDRFQAFRATGTHLTRINGTTPQALYFYYPRDDRSGFANLELSNPAGVSFSSEVVARGNVTLTGTTPVSGGRLWAGGLLSSVAGTSLAGVTDVVIYGNGVFPLMAGVAPPALYLATGTLITAPVGTTTLPGALVVNSGTTLDIGGSTLTVSGALTYSNSSNARLKMNDPAGHLIVKGDAFFNAVDMGDNDLTAGVLELRGNVTVERDRFQAFRASGTHLTKINGTTAQAIYFYYPRDDRSRFRNIEFTNPAGVTFNSEVVASGSASVTGSTNLAGGRLWVGALLASGTNTSLSGLTDAVVYSGTGVFPLISGGAPPALYLATASTIPVPAGSTVFPGNLIVNTATVLDIGANSLTVNGSLEYSNSSNARLKMNDAAGRFTVKGDAFFNAVDMGDGDLTAGVLEVRGNFTVERDRFQAFRATGTHLTKFTGTAAQGIYFYYSADDRSRFQNVEMANSSTAGITGNSAIRAGGNMLQSGRLLMNSSLSIGAALNLGATSNTTAANGVTAASCTAAPGATYSGFTCGASVQGARAARRP